MNSSDCRSGEATTKCSAWDEMEAEPWPTGSSSRLRRGRDGQTNGKKAFSGNISKWLHFRSLPRLYRRGRNRVRAGPSRPKWDRERARSLPQQPSPAPPPNMSDVGGTLARQPPRKHGCLFKEKPPKWDHVEANLPPLPLKEYRAEAGSSAMKVYAFWPKRAEQLE